MRHPAPLAPGHAAAPSPYPLPAAHHSQGQRTWRPADLKHRSVRSPLMTARPNRRVRIVPKGPDRSQPGTVVVEPLMIRATTIYPWQVQFDDAALPQHLQHHSWQAVVLDLRQGFWALEAMIADKQAVGPVLVCALHRRLRVPVEPRDGSPLAARLEFATLLGCPGDNRFGDTRCTGQIWMMPPHGEAALTDFTRLHDAMHRPRGAFPALTPRQSALRIRGFSHLSPG